MIGHVHVIGAGLAGLGAAIELATDGRSVSLYEAANRAGGRCRSYPDPQTGLVIDNGNHLVLAGNRAVDHYCRRIGSVGTLWRPPGDGFPFFDLQSGRRWTLRPSEGRLPWWVLVPGRRVPGTGLADHLALARFAFSKPHPDETVGQTALPANALWRPLIEPLLVAMLNTPVKEASSAMAAQMLRLTLAQGGRACRPLIARPHLADALVDPALHALNRAGASVHFGHRLRALQWADDGIAALDFGERRVPVAPGDRVILAVPAWDAAALLPGLVVPTDMRAIVNAHFAVPPPKGSPAITGLIGGCAEWIFAFEDRISVTVSAADLLIDQDRAVLATRFWQEISIALGWSAPMPNWQIVKEKRATFAATPAMLTRRPATTAHGRNLVLAGDWTATGLPSTIEGALRSGVTAAQSVGAGLTR